MLDQLEVLDDATPPTPDATMLAQVRVRAERRRLRNRLTAVGACVVALTFAVGAVAMLRDGGEKVDVVGPAKKPAASSMVSKGRLPNGLHIRMTVDKSTVALGDEIKARVEVRNDTGTAKTFGVGPIQCVLDVSPVLRDAGDRVVADSGVVGCYPVARDIAAGGSASLTTTLSTDPVVIPRGQDTGQYQLRLESMPFRPTWRLAPVAITVVAPNLSGRIELPSTTFTAGDVAEGTLVIDNNTGASIHFGVNCGSDHPWRVWLSKDGEVFSIPETGTLCPGTPTSAYGTGTIRLPFSVSLRYPSCGQPGNVSAGSPECVPGTYPPLPPGTYQIVFEGRGPLGSVDVAPVSIQIVAAPPK